MFTVEIHIVSGLSTLFLTGSLDFVKSASSSEPRFFIVLSLTTQTHNFSTLSKKKNIVY